MALDEGGGAVDIDGRARAGEPRRARRHGAVGWVACAAVAVGVIGGISLAVDAPQHEVLAPADPGPVEGPVAEPVGGTVVEAPSGGPGWARTSSFPVWQALDQDAGLFLSMWDGAPATSRVSPTTRRTLRVLRRDQEVPVATILCERQCNGASSFGPGPDEVTVLEEEVVRAGHGEHSTCCVARVYGFDGALRDRVDLGGVRQGAGIGDLEWSPDGRRLAISTYSGGPREPGCPDGDCDASEAFLWIMERGRLPVLRYQQSIPFRPSEWNNPILMDLAWSPDGERVGFVATSWLPERAGPATLVAFDVGSSQAQTLHEFDECGPCDPTRWGFAWSPDGRRIAVTDGERIDRLYADGTDTDAPLGNGTGPLAWLGRPRVDPPGRAQP